MFPGGLRPRLKQSESEGVPVFEQPNCTRKRTYRSLKRLQLRM